MVLGQAKTVCFGETGALHLGSVCSSFTLHTAVCSASAGYSIGAAVGNGSLRKKDNSCFLSTVTVLLTMREEAVPSDNLIIQRSIIPTSSKKSKGTLPSYR